MKTNKKSIPYVCRENEESCSPKSPIPKNTTNLQKIEKREKENANKMESVSEGREGYLPKHDILRIGVVLLDQTITQRRCAIKGTKDCKIGLFQSKQQTKLPYASDYGYGDPIHPVIPLESGNVSSQKNVLSQQQQRGHHGWFGEQCERHGFIGQWGERKDKPLAVRKLTGRENWNSMNFVNTSNTIMQTK